MSEKHDQVSEVGPTMRDAKGGFSMIALAWFLYFSKEYVQQLPGPELAHQLVEVGGTMAGMSAAVLGLAKLRAHRLVDIWKRPKKDERE